jgi:hypothetical protein
MLHDCLMTHAAAKHDSARLIDTDNAAQVLAQIDIPRIAMFMARSFLSISTSILADASQEGRAIP